LGYYIIENSNPQGNGGNRMTKELIFLVEESLAGGYEARALGYPIFTEGDTTEEIREKVRDAVACHFEQAEMPSLIRLHFVKDEVKQ
jgi:hypothetical protein